MNIAGRLLLFLRILALLLLVAFATRATLAQLPAQKLVEKSSEKKTETTTPPEKVENPAQIELLETHYRFEANGDSRKEVHTRAHINSELGVRQFARLNFDYNRTFESVEIPLVHITHPSGGTADILPSAISDQPNPAVVNAPAYQDVRVKSVRILGLAPGDLLEYRVITTVTHHPLAPDFWLDHSFERSGVVSQELFELSLPTSRRVQLYTSPATPATTIDELSDGTNPTVTYRWKRASETKLGQPGETAPSEPEIVLTTFETWQQLATRLAKLSETATPVAPVVYEKASALVRAADPNAANSYNPGPKIEALYDFVSQKIRTVDLPLGSTGFHTRAPDEILSSGYGTQEDKFLLFAALARDVVTLPHAGFVSNAMPKETAGIARPTVFDHILTQVGIPSISWWVDLSLEVAPYGMIPSQFRAKRALMILPNDENVWRDIPIDFSFAGNQSVNVDATLAPDGKLSAKVHYSLRGDNELLLRVAFHQAPKDKWKELAQLLSLSDGFRGQVTRVSASDPYATREPFTVDYEITQPKFVDWSKRPVRIPALLPQLGLPDLPAKPASGTASSPIELGTPLEVETHMTLHLPPGTAAATPTGTSVQRDYAAFASQYSVKGPVVNASRHIHFLLRQVPAARAADYNAFLHAVQSDQAQLFTLDRESPPSPVTKPATRTDAPTAPPKP
jgi:Domain of Unknown Function with PDB structure (DUF3857)